ncbi:hypothetical protein ATANTOWER_028856, partial [Ataeniobius toweri]|nr:hypothetical protein [Ataeniobius toweri]
MTVRHHHKDQADGKKQITLWEYFRRAAEKSACQEGQASEQLSPFWGTRLAVPLPGTGPLHCGSAPASSASCRQRQRRRAPDSMAGRGDASAPCSTGGPHDDVTPGSGARSPPLSGFAPEERTAEPSTSAAVSSELVTPMAASPPAAAEFPAGFSSSPGRSRRRRAVVTERVRVGASSLSRECPSAMASSRLSSPDSEGGCPAPSAGLRSLVRPPTPAWVLARLQIASRECMRERFMECVPHLMVFPQDLVLVHSILQAEFLKEGWHEAPAPLSAGGPFAPLLEAVSAAASSPEPQPAAAGSTGPQPAAAGSPKPQPAAAGSPEPQPAASRSTGPQPA